MTIYRKHRCRQIDFGPVRNDNDVTMLGQWTYTQLGESKTGTYKTYSFRSIVRRRGMPGLWLDTPYYCYSGGEHRYRRLPAGLAAKIYLYSINGWLHRTFRTVRRKVMGVAYRAYRIAQHWTPAEIVARWRATKEVKALFGDGGER